MRMLKKFNGTGIAAGPFGVGTPVFVVLRDGTILEGFHVQSRLMDLVSLDRSPLDDTEKQGFTLQGTQLLPNWCEGKRKILAACSSRQEAEDLVSQFRLTERNSQRQTKQRPMRPSCK